MPVLSLVLRALHAPPVGSMRLGSDFRPTPLVTAAAVGRGGSRWDGWCRLPHPTPAPRSPLLLPRIVESAMSGRNTKTPPRPRPPRRVPLPTTAPGGDDLRRAARIAAHDRRHAEECATIAALPVRQEHAASID